MSREHDCVNRSHIHVGQCQRAGYAYGRADALDEVEEAIRALADEIEGERDSLREAFRQHNANRAEGRPVKRPDLRVWGDAYEVVGRKVRGLLS